ncbi:MAG: hypothetical protein LBC40_05235 [Dysgonamonadaceae bacterium]|jgi:hypothetical protein|nr:hypothetical protein [Dysgonamonadaceae bacterium]
MRIKKKNGQQAYAAPRAVRIRIGLESFLLDTIAPTMAVGSPQYTPYDDTAPEIEGDIWF